MSLPLTPLQLHIDSLARLIIYSNDARTSMLEGSHPEVERRLRTIIRVGRLTRDEAITKTVRHAIAISKRELHQLERPTIDAEPRFPSAGTITPDKLDTL